ncbi:MAG: hypothetical protein ABEK04_02565, partial [Candidatus Nanohalobium sp.]
SLSDSINSYGEISSELKEMVDRLESEDLIDAELNEQEPAEVDLQPESDEDYREIDRVFRESGLDLPSEKKQLSRGDVEVDTVNVNTSIVKNAESLDEELEEHEEEILRLLDENDARNVFTKYGRETILDYEADGLTKKAHEAVDRSEALQKVRRALIGSADKEIVAEEIGPDYDSLEFTDPEHERATEYFEDLDRPGSEEFLEALEELEEEGLLELKYSTDST